MLTEDFRKTLESIDTALVREAEAGLARLDLELEFLRERQEVARTVATEGASALGARVDVMVEQKSGERALLAHYRDAVCALMDGRKGPSGLKTVVGSAPAPSVPKPTPAPAGPVARALRGRELRARQAAEPEAAPAAPPAEEPTVVEPPAPPKKPPFRAMEFRRSQTAFFKREREFHGAGGWSPEREAELKSLVCEARRLVEIAKGGEQDDTEIWRSVRDLKDEFNERTDFAPFFGFNNTRSHRPEIWESLAEGYTLLAAAEACLQWMEEQGDAIPETERRELIVLCAAPEAWLHRLEDEHGLGFTDEQQRHVHSRVERLREGVWVPWWSSGEGRVATEEVAREAKRLPARYAEIKKRLDSGAAKDRAMEALTELAGSLEAEGEIEETLVPAVQRCLEAGVAPSNKALIAACLPYRAVLREHDERVFSKLNEYLARAEAQMAAQHQTPVDPDEPEDPEYQRLLDELRGHLRGKTLLFVGGRRIPEKKKEVERELALKELLWPDADPDTLLHDFTASAMKADVVCYLIRWSRHSYKKVIDLAKANGKETVTLKAGLGVHRLVHDLHEQLISKRGERGEG